MNTGDAEQTAVRVLAEALLNASAGQITAGQAGRAAQALVEEAARQGPGTPVSRIAAAGLALPPGAQLAGDAGAVDLADTPVRAYQRTVHTRAGQAITQQVRATTRHTAAAPPAAPAADSSTVTGWIPQPEWLAGQREWVTKGEAAWGRGTRRSAPGAAGALAAAAAQAEPKPQGEWAWEAADRAHADDLDRAATELHAQGATLQAGHIATAAAALRSGRRHAARGELAEAGGADDFLRRLSAMSEHSPVLGGAVMGDDHRARIAAHAAYIDQALHDEQGGTGEAAAAADRERFTANQVESARASARAEAAMEARDAARNLEAKHDADVKKMLGQIRSLNRRITEMQEAGESRDARRRLALHIAIMAAGAVLAGAMADLGVPILLAIASAAVMPGMVQEFADWLAKL